MALSLIRVHHTGIEVDQGLSEPCFTVVFWYRDLLVSEQR